MKDEGASPIDKYLEGLEEGQCEALEKLRAAIKAAAPDAVETISYGMPAFKYRVPLVGFAAFKDHLSFFPMSVAVIEARKEELEKYDTSKGTIRFQPEKPLPTTLVKKLVKARIKETEEGKGWGAGRKPAMKRARHPMPDYVERELEGRGLMDAYRKRPPYQQNDYVGWISQAKQEATRQKRLEQMLEELEAGDAYMKMPYRPKRPRDERS